MSASCLDINCSRKRNDVITPGQPTTATLVVVGAEGGEERQLVHFELALLDGENPRWLTIAWNPAG